MLYACAHVLQLENHHMSVYVRIIKEGISATIAYAPSISYVM